MRLFRIVGLSVLSVVLCLFLAWGAMVIVHAGEEKASGIGEFPAAAGAPAVVGTASDVERPPAPPAPPGGSTVPSAAGPPAFGAVGVPYSSFPPGRRIRSNPLKDVTDLSKATMARLQGGDRFLESQTLRLAEQYAKAEDAEAQAKLKGELAKTIEKHFDVRHQVRKREVDELEARVKKLREHLQKREGARQAIVEMRLGQFIRAAEGLGWDTDFGRTRSPFDGAGGLPMLPSVPSSNKRGLEFSPPRQSANPARR